MKRTRLRRSVSERLGSLLPQAALLPMVWLLPLLGGGCGLFGPNIPDPVQPELLLVDSTEAAYTVFTAQPLRLSRAEMQELTSRTELNPGVDLMTWVEFLDDQAALFDAAVQQDQYPGSDMRAGMLQLLQRYPGVPFGVTWNGGIAFTFQDYQYARRTHELFVADPTALRRAEGSMTEQDPLVPALHLGPMLGWK
jgi:hypothetical protein